MNSYLRINYSRLTLLIGLAVFITGCQTIEEEAPPPVVDNSHMISQLEQIGVSVHEDERGVIITLLTVYFDFDKSNLKASSRATIAQMADILDLPQAQNRRITIEGHTDSVGDPNYNVSLSAKRAEVVLKELAFSDVSEDRMTSSANGEGSPVADNASSTGRQENRRVEIIIHNPKVITAN
jgi:outer membrane protein OmpA-like peptidoglycan-associated protein